MVKPKKVIYQLWPQKMESTVILRQSFDISQYPPFGCISDCVYVWTME